VKITKEKTAGSRVGGMRDMTGYSTSRDSSRCPSSALSISR